MRKQMLVIAALCAGMSISIAHAAPTGGALGSVKATADKSSVVTQVHYRRGHWRHHHRSCWWRDRVFCRMFWW